jgi:hypothetical protein
MWHSALFSCASLQQRRLPILQVTLRCSIPVTHTGTNLADHFIMNMPASDISIARKKLATFDPGSNWSPELNHK